MTTLTGPDEENLKRLNDLKKVRAEIRGLSIEPLWERIPARELDLDGIHWVILGGESGSGLKYTRPFALEWAEEIRDHCRQQGVAFFMKQLGRNPSRNGKVFKLRDGHGGNWDEWKDEALKVREFPAAFHDYRKDEMRSADKMRPIKQKKKKAPDQTTTADEVDAEVVHTTTGGNTGKDEENAIKVAEAEFQRLNEIVRKGVTGFVEAGEALRKIHDEKLWRAGGFETWEDYCRSVAGMSRVHAYRLMQASECAAELKLVPNTLILPVSESQVRPLLRLVDSEDRHTAWEVACSSLAGEGKQPTAGEVRQAVEIVLLDSECKTEQKLPTRTQQRADLVSRLRATVSERKSWEDVEMLLVELEELL